jgi:(4S)-4-hydroxy-5-phosphonooxypentane-2,3-dione isomerase
MSDFVLVVHVKIKPEAVDEFMPMALANAAASRSTEPGCRQFDVIVDPEDRTKIVYYEVYDDADAFDAHQQTAHFKKYLETAVPLLESRARTIYARIAP